MVSFWRVGIRDGTGKETKGGEGNLLRQRVGRARKADSGGEKDELRSVVDTDGVGRW